MDKSEDLQTPKRRIDSMAIALPIRIPFDSPSEPREQDTKAMVMIIIVFLIEKILFILTGRCRRLTSPAGAEDKTTTQQKSVYIDHRRGAQSSRAELSQSEIETKGNTKKNEKNKQKSHEANSDPHACLCHGVYRHGHRQLGRGCGLGR